MSTAHLPPGTIPSEVDSEFELDEIHYEIIDGQRVETLAMSAFEMALASMLLVRIMISQKNRTGLGIVEQLFLLDAERDLQRRPDLAFVSYDRWPSVNLSDETDAAWKVIPNLAVEIVSRTNRFNEIEEKVLEYFQYGVELVWVIQPRSRRIYVYSSPGEVSIVEAGGRLGGGTVLPDFEVATDDLFNELRRPG